MNEIYQNKILNLSQYIKKNASLTIKTLMFQQYDELFGSNCLFNYIFFSLKHFSVEIYIKLSFFIVAKKTF